MQIIVNFNEIFIFALGFKATQSFKACNAHNDLLWSQNKTVGFLTCDIKTEIEKVIYKILTIVAIYNMKHTLTACLNPLMCMNFYDVK